MYASDWCCPWWLGVRKEIPIETENVKHESLSYFNTTDWVEGSDRKIFGLRLRCTNLARDKEPNILLSGPTCLSQYEFYHKTSFVKRKEPVSYFETKQFQRGRHGSYRKMQSHSQMFFSLNWRLSYWASGHVITHIYYNVTSLECILIPRSHTLVTWTVRVFSRIFRLHRCFVLISYWTKQLKRLQGGPSSTQNIDKSPELKSSLTGDTHEAMKRDEYLEKLPSFSFFALRERTSKLHKKVKTY